MEQNTISVIESGRNFPTLVTLEKIANIFNIDLSDFFNYEYFEDIDYIKNYSKNQLDVMNEYQVRELFKFIKTIL